MSKTNYQRVTTPAGIAIYPWLNKPDTKFDDAGVFRVTLSLEDNEETQAFLSKVEAVRDEFVADLDAKKRKTATIAEVSEPELDDAGEETGRVLVKAKMKHTITPKNGDAFTQSPNIFDASKPPKPLTGVNVGTGSILKIAGELIPYHMASSKTIGVSLRMKAAQVIELKEFGGQDAASYGFDGVDGGFEATEPSADAEDGDAEDNFDY